MPKEHRKDRIPRQQPVSCRFCRARKLRCSREIPCSNCLSRGIPCDPVSTPAPALGNSQTSDSETHERLRKLEELLDIRKSQQSESSEGTRYDPISTPAAVSVNSQTFESETLERLRRLEELLDSRSSRSESVEQRSTDQTILQQQQPKSSNTTSQLQHLSSDVAWLESIYMASDHPVSRETAEEVYPT